MFKYVKNNKRAFSLITAGATVFLMLHLGEDFIIPDQTPSFLRLLYKGVPYLGIITGIFFLFGEASAKHGSVENNAEEFNDGDSGNK